MKTTPPPPLPLNSHRSGTASPLPAPARAPQPQPPVRAPAPKPVPVVIPDDDSDDPDVTTVLVGEPGSEVVAATAGRHRRAVDLARQRAEDGQAEAERLVAEARAEAERIIAEAQAAAAPLALAARTEGRQADQLEQRARQLARAATATAQAEAAEAKAKALEDERDELGRQRADLGRQKAELAAERREAESALAAARDDADLERMTALRARIDSIDDLTGVLTGKMAPLTARIDEIGTGEDLEHRWQQGLPHLELRAARAAADSARRSAREGLNAAWPDRPEAVGDILRKQLRDPLEGFLQGEPAPARPKTQVYGPGVLG